MRQTLKMRPQPDQIDGLVDGLLADPARADETKRVLRRRLRAVERRVRDAPDELDLWDNVPV